MAKPVTPEPKFFLVDELYARGIEYYYSTWFADLGSARVAGEKSTNYMESSVVAQRILEHLPQAKLIFILREPVSRAFNNYLWSKGNGLETLDFSAAVAREEEREAVLEPRHRYSRPIHTSPGGCMRNSCGLFLPASRGKICWCSNSRISPPARRSWPCVSMRF
jgi:hypothetical protein